MQATIVTFQVEGCDYHAVFAPALAAYQYEELADVFAMNFDRDDLFDTLRALAVVWRRELSYGEDRLSGLLHAS